MSIRDRILDIEKRINEVFPRNLLVCRKVDGKTYYEGEEIGLDSVDDDRFDVITIVRHN